jgi:hypothetical protein
MKKMVTILGIFFLFLIGCGCEKGNNANKDPQKIDPEVENTNKIKSFIIKGSCKLVKTADSGIVYLIQDGKKNTISAWGWIEKNCPQKEKHVKTISQKELDTFPFGDVNLK